MAVKSSIGEKIFQILNNVFMTFLIAVTVYPLLYVAFASVSQPMEMISHAGFLIKPLGFTLGSYKEFLRDPNIITGYANTLFIVVVGTFFNIIITSLAAYVLSRKNVFWNKYLMFFIVFTMFFSGGLIPFYLVVNGLGLRNSLFSVIIPFAINTFNLIMMRTSFQGIPDSIEESAKLDGASHITILFRIIMPLSLPVIAVMILYYSVEKWNGWFYASLFIQDRSRYPLQVILRDILITNATDAMSDGAATDKYMKSITIKYAAIMVATLPIMFVYPFLQKYFVKGMLVGAVKG